LLSECAAHILPPASLPSSTASPNSAQ
jgi:hypothetical protein